MRKWMLYLSIVALLVSSLACRTLFPVQDAGAYDALCRESVDGMLDLKKTLEFPAHLQQQDPVRTGDEFDVNQYFDVLTRLKMQPGLVLDYAYMNDGFGGMPLLYARPASQPPYPTSADYYRADPPSYLSSVIVEDTPEGYFQYATLVMLAGEFYLYWHANYGSREIVCGSADLDRIITAHQGESTFGVPMTAVQAARARAIAEPGPVITMSASQVQVRLVVFSDWGGFYRRTYTISRSFPHEILDVRDDNLVEYDCGIVF